MTQRTEAHAQVLRDAYARTIEHVQRLRLTGVAEDELPDVVLAVLVDLLDAQGTDLGEYLKVIADALEVGAGPVR